MNISVNNSMRNLPSWVKGLLHRNSMHRNLPATTLKYVNGTGMELPWLLAPKVGCEIWPQINWIQVSSTLLICPLVYLSSKSMNLSVWIWNCCFLGGRYATWSAWALRVWIYQYAHPKYVQIFKPFQTPFPLQIDFVVFFFIFCQGELTKQPKISHFVDFDWENASKQLVWCVFRVWGMPSPMV